ncbi:MAG: hypothetical protein MJZ64_08175 [Paludibacteraceae bacterium]|nr:hypothetical protein [Paludibacteraceae bacterium]
MEKKATYWRWAGWLVSITAIVYLGYKLTQYDHYADLAYSLQHAGAVEWCALTISALLIPIQLWAEVHRWKWTLRGWKDISVYDGWRQVLTGSVAGFLTPYRAGDIPARLVMAGLTIDKDQLKANGWAWLKDWRKWFPVIVWTIIRYLLWGVQLWGVLRFAGVELTWIQAISSIAMYYVIISIMPSLPAAEVVLKGGWAVLIFGQYTENVAAITLAVSLIWIFNTIMPVLFGSLGKILYFCKQK